MTRMNELAADYQRAQATQKLADEKAFEAGLLVDGLQREMMEEVFSHVLDNTPCEITFFFGPWAYTAIRHWQYARTRLNHNRGNLCEKFVEKYVGN